VVEWATTGEVPAVTGQGPAVTEPVSDLTVRVPATTSTEQLSPAAEPTVGLPVTVIGVADERLDLLSPEARQALVEAEVVVGGRRQLWLWQSWPGRPPVGPGGWTPETLEVGADVDELARTVRQRAVEASRRVCVLASGDPGFFGIVRALVRMVDRRALRVLPAPSSVSQAFARLGLPWDDAMVVSVYGRSLADAASILRTAPKAAVLTSPDSPPEAVGRALLEAGAIMDLVAVCSRLGSSEERVTELTLSDLAAGRFDPLSVVVLIGPGSLPLVGWAPGHARQEGGDANGPMSAKVLAWGLPDSAFTHRAGMITKAEVRSVALGKLALPAAGVLWDVGAGSGSVAVECALLRPGLTVLAVEESPDDAARASTNALALGAGVHVVTGSAPEALVDLPSPDRAFVGGGGIAVLDAVLAHLRPGGRVVATFAALDRAVAAADRLGNMVQVGVGRGERLPDGGWRLAARNPVFVVWGPGDSSPEEPEPEIGAFA
jgi:precorrin-6B C5,15-methyltransferase / cobalt-precorrin-6B C5,C15-methyltransferase